MDALTLETSVRVHPDVVWRDIDGEVVVLNVATGQYFGLDSVGSAIWMMLGPSTSGEPGPGVSLGSLRDRVVAEFEVDGETAARDIVDLMTNLASQQLIATGA
jgi:hypothetical protein